MFLRLPRVRASRLSILWGAIDAVSSDKLGRIVLMQTIFLAPLTSSARKDDSKYFGGLTKSQTPKDGQSNTQC